MPTLSSSQLRLKPTKQLAPVQRTDAGSATNKTLASKPTMSVVQKQKLNIVYQGFSGGQVKSQISRPKTPGQRFLQTIPDAGSASPEAQKELHSIERQMDSGIELSDIGLSPELQEILNRPEPSFRILSQKGEKSLSTDSLAGMDLRQADLGAYKLKDVAYSGETQFPKGFQPGEVGMLRIKETSDPLDTHLTHSPKEQSERLLNRILQSKDIYPNPNSNKNEQPSLLSRAEYLKETAAPRQDNVKARFATERALVKKHGGYKQAQQALRQEAGGDTKRFQTLMADKLGHHRNANHLAKSESEVQQKLQLAERKLIHDKAQPSQSEIDRDWQKVDLESKRVEADKIWSNSDKSEREKVLRGFYSEQVALNKDKLQRVQDYAGKNPESSGLSGMMSRDGIEKLEAIQAKIQQGNLSQADLDLRRHRDLDAVIKISDDNDVAALKSIKNMKASDQRLQAETTKFQKYQKEGWWNDSPAWAEGPEAFLKDIAARPLHTLSPLDADRTLEAVAKLKKQKPAFPGLDKIESNARRQKDLQSVGDQWSGLQDHFGKVLDHQGVIGKTADWTKNNLGRKGGWVVDSKLGSSAVMKNLKQAHKANLAVKELAHFQGTDAEFKAEYQKRVQALATELKSVKGGIANFQDSQENWVNGVSDLTSATAALVGTAAAPLTGGASLALGAGLGASVKVGTKGLEAFSGNAAYQGSVTQDLLSGGLNGGLAVGTNQASRKALTKFLPRDVSALRQFSTRAAVAAGEGAADGYLGQFGNTLIQGGSLSEAHGNGTKGAVLGAIFNPAFQGVTGQLTKPQRVPDFDQFKITPDKVDSQNVRFVDSGSDASRGVKKALENRPLRVMTTGYSKAPVGYDVNTPGVLNEIGGDLGDQVGFVTSPTASKGSIDALTSSVAQKQGAPVAYLTADRYIKYIDPQKLPNGIDSAVFSKQQKFSLPTKEAYLEASSEVSNRLLMAGGREAAVNDFQNAIQRGNKVVVMTDDAIQAPAWSSVDGKVDNGSAYVAAFLKKDTGGIPLDHGFNKEFATFLSQNAERVASLVKVVDASEPGASKLASGWLAQ